MNIFYMENFSDSIDTDSNLWIYSIWKISQDIFIRKISHIQTSGYFLSWIHIFISQILICEYLLYENYHRFKSLNIFYMENITDSVMGICDTDSYLWIFSVWKMSQIQFWQYFLYAKYHSFCWHIHRKYHIYLWIKFLHSKYFILKSMNIFYTKISQIEIPEYLLYGKYLRYWNYKFLPKQISKILMKIKNYLENSL